MYNLIKNLTKDLNRHFSKEGIPVTNRYVKMRNITNHQGNANQNHSEMSLHTCGNSHHPKETISAGKDVEEREPHSLLVGI